VPERPQRGGGKGGDAYKVGKSDSKPCLEGGGEEEMKKSSAVKRGHDVKLFSLRPGQGWGITREGGNRLKE